MTQNSTFRSVLIAVLSLSIVLGLGFLAYPYLPDFSQVPPHPETVTITLQPMFKAPQTQDGVPIFNRIYENNSASIEDLYLQIRELGLKTDCNTFSAGDREFAAQWYYIALGWHENYRDGLREVFFDSHPPVSILPSGYYRKFIDLDVAFHDAIRELETYKDYPDAKLFKEEVQEPWNVLLGYWDLLQDIHEEMVKLSSYYPQGFRLIDVAEAELLSTFLEFRYANMLEDMEQFKYMDRTQGEAMEELQMAYQDEIAELKRMGDRKTFLLQLEEARRKHIKCMMEIYDSDIPILVDTASTINPSQGRSEFTPYGVKSVIWAYIDFLIADIEKRDTLRYTDAEFEKLDAHLTTLVDCLIKLENIKK